MRAEVTPGLAQTITVSISNTETIIAGYTVRILGADPGWVELEADSISLFPDETRTFEASVYPPRGIPAGSRRVAVQVRELTPPYDTSITEVELTVPEAAAVELRVDPIAVTAGKRATFSLLVENTGNTDIKGYLSGDDPENKVRFGFDTERIVLPPAQHAVVDMRVAARRRFFGTPIVRPLSVYMEPVPQDAFFNPDAPPALKNDEREVLATATFVQKSVMSRGALSLLGLLFAATVFAIVITVALSRLVAQSTADRNLALQVAAARQSPSATGTSGVAGTVTLLTSGKAVPGVGVSVFTTSDTATPVATTATDARGAYRVTDLAAGQYKLSFRGAGFVQLWYPRAADVSDATTITLATGQVK
ncbi:MAG TPA: carboxypeptidase regulatory-like domain-containing protein, partial [Jatrophihabitans sp.]|nr:carboxypeptidase regulatory-like domain-containing protein [Jatrophihabitans sp.]